MRSPLLILICHEGCFRYWPKLVAMRTVFQTFENFVPSFSVSTSDLLLLLPELLDMVVS